MPNAPSPRQAATETAFPFPAGSSLLNDFQKRLAESRVQAGGRRLGERRRRRRLESRPPRTWSVLM